MGFLPLFLIPGALAALVPKMDRSGMTDPTGQVRQDFFRAPPADKTRKCPPAFANPHKMITLYLGDGSGGAVAAGPPHIDQEKTDAGDYG